MRDLLGTKQRQVFAVYGFFISLTVNLTPSFLANERHLYPAHGQMTQASPRTLPSATVTRARHEAQRPMVNVSHNCLTTAARSRGRESHKRVAYNPRIGQLTLFVRLLQTSSNA